jgi:hypothetical protein
MQPHAAEIEYPESDGKPMSDNTLQAFWIILLYTNLNALYPDFVAADLLWYPVRGSKKALAPDVMVAIGRPKGHRRTYKPWEEAEIQPQVVFEIRSPSNSNAEMALKRLDYEKYGVEEYYHYDPDRNFLEVYVRREGRLALMPVVGSFDSPLLGIRFLLRPTGLEVRDASGQPFRLLEEERAQRALAERQAAAAAQQAEEAVQAAAEAERAAEGERALREAAESRAERLAARLRALGLEE